MSQGESDTDKIMIDSVGEKLWGRLLKQEQELIREDCERTTEVGEGDETEKKRGMREEGIKLMIE